MMKMKFPCTCYECGKSMGWQDTPHGLCSSECADKWNEKACQPEKPEKRERVAPKPWRRRKS